jgi:hypothetical protein
MKRDNPGSLLLVASVLVLAAICGYVVGHGRGGGTPVEAQRDATNANTLLEYPERAGWRPAPHVPAITGLSFTQPLALAPAGNTTSAGLIAGQLVVNGWAPLPAAFLAHTRELPKTEIVELENTQAYKYSGVEAGASRTAFALYTIPSSSPSQPAVVCYAPVADTATMRTCEGIAGSLTVTYSAGVTPIDALIPDAAYAHEVGAALVRVDQLRAELRTGIGGSAPQGAVATLGVRVADGLSSVVGSLSGAHAPAAAEQVHAALLRSLSSAGEAYSALAAAARAGSQAGYEEARTRVAAAESGLNGVLAAYSLLGYG